MMKVVQVGLGAFGSKRSETLIESGLFDLVACYDLNKSSMEAIAARYNAKTVNSFDELLEYPEIEAVFISTGASLHATQAIKAAEKGLNVFIEKPLCSTQEEAEELLAVERERGVIIGSGHLNHKTDAVSATIKQMLDSGEIGTVATFEKTTCHSGGQFIKEGDWRGIPDKNPGGMLFQCGIHGIHELLFYFGNVKRVFSLMRYDVLATKTADVAICQLEFESGLIGTLNAYHTSPYVHNFNIFGTKKNIYKNDRFFDEGTLLFSQETKLDNQKEELKSVRLISTTDPFGNIRSFYNAIRNNEELYPSLKDAAKAVKIVFAAEKSAKTGKIIEIKN